MTLNTKDLFGDITEVSVKEYSYPPFYEKLLNCTSCSCRAEASKVVPGIGPKDAQILFLGRNPGRDEDKLGIPFIGRGGNELTRMCQALGIDRLKVAILNIVKCHTMGDRPPKPIEILTCTSLWLPQELEFYNKVSIIFPLGREATQVMLGLNAESTGKREGYWVKVQNGTRIFNICPLNHPGYLLRQPGKQMQMYDATLPAVRRHLLETFKEIYEQSREA